MSVARVLRGGCRGSLREERQGLPGAGHSRFCTALVDPLYGTAEPLSQDDDICRKTHPERAKCHMSAWGKKCEKQPCERPGQWRKKRRRGSRHWRRDSSEACGTGHGAARISLQPVEEYTRAGICLAACGEHHARAGGYSLKELGIWIAHTGAGLPWSPAACEKDPCLRRGKMWGGRGGREQLQWCDPSHSIPWNTALHSCVNTFLFHSKLCFNLMFRLGKAGLVSPFVLLWGLY